jgi:hypothetical protein
MAEGAVASCGRVPCVLSPSDAVEVRVGGDAGSHRLSVSQVVGPSGLEVVGYGYSP